MRTLRADKYRPETDGYGGKSAKPKVRKEILYPDSDGKPMSDNTKQFEWIVKIKENLEVMFENDPDVFIAGDLLWYPVKDDNKTRIGPDVLAAIGRPKGHRGSYRTWEEGHINPQVVFEILSPGNRAGEMKKKFEFYNRHGVEEYYLYDPDKLKLEGWLRSGSGLVPIQSMQGWISPRLNIRFELQKEDLTIFYPDGTPFLTTIELNRLRKIERQKTETERQRAEAERIRAETESEKAETERIRAETESKKAETERQRAEKAEKKANIERNKMEAERKRAKQAVKRAEAERQRADQLVQKLRELGIEV